MDALRDVSREVVTGNLRTAFENGLLKDKTYDKDSLESAYTIF